MIKSGSKGASEGLLSSRPCGEGREVFQLNDSGYQNTACIVLKTRVLENSVCVCLLTNKNRTGQRES